MKGYIWQRSKGSWTIVLDVGRVLREMLLALEKGTYVKRSRLTLAEWLTQWYESYVVMHTNPRTQESFRSIIRLHLVPALGSIQLTQLQPQHLQSYYVACSCP